MTPWDYAAIGFMGGWLAGWILCWGYFLRNRLIRTRREYYADRKARGVPVPDDWDRPDRSDYR